jgi:hypothetical protein
MSCHALMFVFVQTTRVTSGTIDLLSFVWGLSGGASRLLLGASRNAANPPYEGWAWIDATPTTNLNCGSTSCAASVYGPGQPEYVEGHCGIS